ncbi:MAG: hypothetical protein LBE76_08185 [Nitrososphaerota archaeon]|jgi:hypothetical protein|nr:hypothetical protein [Nitrososphaerota archaeon]
MTAQPQQVQEAKSPVCETHSVNLSALIKQHIASLPSPEGWRVLAIDPINDAVVLIREVKTE